jgi:hypothetical protein
VAQLAATFRVRASRAQRWLAKGLFAGAYRAEDGAWLVPPGVVEEFIRQRQEEALERWRTAAPAAC